MVSVLGVGMRLDETITVPCIIESQTVLNHTLFIHQLTHTCPHALTGVPTYLLQTYSASPGSVS